VCRKQQRLKRTSKANSDTTGTIATAVTQQSLAAVIRRQMDVGAVK